MLFCCVTVAPALIYDVAKQLMPKGDISQVRIP